MLAALLRSTPMPLFQPLRHAARLSRRNPCRQAAMLVLRRALRAHRGTLSHRVAAIRPVDAPELSFEPSDSMVMDAVYWVGVRGYEGTVADTWVALCARAGSVLEVGGNVGIFSVLGARARAGNGRAAAGCYTVVEPLPQNVATLRANLSRNGLGHVEVMAAAAIPGAEPAPVRINIPDEGRANPVGAHVTLGSEVAARSSKDVVTVPGLPMAMLAAGRDLIKIDAEGLEWALLRTIREQLVQDGPTLMIEVLPESTGLAAFLAELAPEAGYRIYALPEYGSDRPVPLAPGDFTAASPGRHNAKDVVLTRTELPRTRGPGRRAFA